MAKSPGRFDVSWDAASGISFKEALGKRQPCGVYRLRVAEGDGLKSYVGKTKNVVSRVAQHRRRFGDALAGVDFRVEKPADLEQREREMIAHFDGLGTLHNTQFTWFPDRPRVELDGVVDPDWQGRWWRGEHVEPLGVMKRPPGLAPVTKFAASLRGRPDYDEILAMLCVYVEAAIPAPRRTVGRYWTIERAPGRGEVKGVVRVRVNGLDVLTISELPGKGRPLLYAVPRLSEVIVASKRIKVQEGLALKVATLFAGEAKEGKYRLPEFSTARDMERNLSRTMQRRAARTVTLARMRWGRVDHSRHEVAIAKDVLARIGRG